MQPGALDDEGHVERVSSRYERLAGLHELVTEHTAVLQELKDLHAVFLDIAGKPMDIAERRAKQSEIVSAEVELVEQALDLQRTVQDLLSQYRLLLPTNLDATVRDQDRPERLERETVTARCLQMSQQAAGSSDAEALCNLLRQGLCDGWVTEEQILAIVGRALATKRKARRGQ